MKKLFLRAEFGPLWEPWEEDEIGRKTLLLRCSTLLSSDNLEGENKEIRGFETTLSLQLQLRKSTSNKCDKVDFHTLSKQILRSK